MGLHFWLIPALAILSVAIGFLYVAVRFTGGSGVRDDGRTVVDLDEPPVPNDPSIGWNYIERR